jgi:hypothetical protein
LRTLLAGEKTNIGGFELNTLKKLKGDRFGMPPELIVLAKEMGLGPTELCKYPCNLAGAIWFGSILIMLKKGFLQIYIKSVNYIQADKNLIQNL